MNTFWVHKNWKWKKENATAKYVDAQCEEAVTLADAQATIAALQAERDEYKTMYACLTGETYDNPIADLYDQLAQRTAELEAAKAIQAIDLKNNNAYREQVANLQAELERVRRELVEATHNANVYQSLYSTGCMDRALLENELRDIRTLIAALPKVEGEIMVSERLVLAEDPDMCSDMSDKEEAVAYAALLKHRQGMEG